MITDINKFIDSIYDTIKDIDFNPQPMYIVNVYLNLSAAIGYLLVLDGILVANGGIKKSTGAISTLEAIRKDIYPYVVGAAQMIGLDTIVINRDEYNKLNNNARSN